MEVKGRHLVMVFWNLGLGGVQTRMRAVAKKITSQGGKVTIILDKRVKNEIQLPENPNLEIVSYGGEKFKELKRPFRRIGAAMGWGKLKFLWWLAKCLWRMKPDVVLAVSNRFAAFSTVINCFLGVINRKFKLVINEGIVTSKYLDQYESPIWKKIVSLTYPLADIIVVPTKSVKNDLINNFGINRNKIVVIPSWVEKREKSAVKKIFEGIYVGRLSTEKGIEVVIDLAREIKKRNLNYKIAVVGEGIMADYLNNLIIENKIGKYLVNLGYQQQSEVMELIKKSRLLLLPSRNEGMPMAVLEAYSMGVPAAVTPFPGAGEIVINNKTGILTKMESKDYINKVLKLWGEKRKMKIMGATALKYVRIKYSERNLQRFIEVVFG